MRGGCRPDAVIVDPLPPEGEAIRRESEKASRHAADRARVARTERDVSGRPGVTRPGSGPRGRCRSCSHAESTDDRRNEWNRLQHVARCEAQAFAYSSADRDSNSKPTN